MLHTYTHGTYIYIVEIIIIRFNQIIYIYAANQVSVSPKVDFLEDDKNDQVPPKIQGVRVIVQANKFNDGKFYLIYSFQRNQAVCLA